MDFNETKNDLDIIEWLDTINARDNTVINYSRSMSNFTEYIGKTPGQLLEDAKDEIRAGKLVSERSLKKQIVGFRKHLQDRGLAPKTIKLYMAGVMSFYRSNDIEVPKLPKAGQKARPLERHMDVPTKDILQNVLKVCDPLEKALVLAGCSSGMGAEEIIRITVGQFKNGYDPETGITIISMRRTKSDTDFITFFSPEASQAILEYLEYRNMIDARDDPIQTQRREKQMVRSDSGYLFVMKAVPDTYLKSHNEELRKYNSDRLGKLYRRVSIRAGVSADKGVWNLIRAHNMRKYYNSTMLNAGADSHFIEYTMGHTIPETRAAYFVPNPPKLKEQYMQYIHVLRLMDTVDLEDSEEYQNALAAKSKMESLFIRSTLQQDNNERMIVELKDNMRKSDERYEAMALAVQQLLDRK